MALIDWVVLLGTLIFIVVYGVIKTRKNQSVEDYLKGGSMKWYTIGLSIMATQASAITFLSTPGQAYQDGMGFLQFYFGQPIALVIVAAFFLPIFYRLKVYTAYEYLEQRFNASTRVFTAILFLLSRGLAAGITIYAPAIILSTVLGWDLRVTNVVVGLLVIVYTVSGGTKAVSMTQKWQMAIILIGMTVAFGFTIHLLPDEVGVLDGVNLAGNLGKLDIVDTSLNFESRYNIWAAFTGGVFLALSYFGTDQSQVGRYLGGKSITESKLGLMFNALLKVPMQAFILFVGVMVFVFYQFNPSPTFFNQSGWQTALKKDDSGRLIALNTEMEQLQADKIALNTQFATTGNTQYAEQAKALYAQEQVLRKQVKEVITEVDEKIATKDTDYVFLRFVLDHLPAGLIGLILAVILSAAMSSTAGELNALSSTTMVDIVKKYEWFEITEGNELMYSKILTAIWGVLAICIALVAGLFDNLIELVNYLGSLFYGTILGVFVAGFFIKFIKGRAVFIGALIAQAVVFFLFAGNIFSWWPEIGYLWFNVVGCLIVVLVGIIAQQLED